jgi:multidrug efflux system outer membrane protein
MRRESRGWDGWLGLGCVVLLAGCAGLRAPAPQETPPAPAAWQSPLPGVAVSPMADLARWWQQFDDPLLSELIDAGQALSPDVASAALRIEEARLASVQAGAAVQPAVQAQGSAARGRPDLVTPVGNTQSLGLNLSWELDVFGAGRAAQRAAQARWDGAQAGWHDARVVVAAEVAQAYVGLRTCEALLVPAQADAQSRLDTGRLTELSARAGLQAPATAALARASAAQGQMQVIDQRAQCLASEQALLAWSGWPLERLRGALAPRTARLPQPVALAVASVPAQVLAQRPDVFNAERDVLAAEAELAQRRAVQLPRVSLSGNVGRTRIEAAGMAQSGTVWTVGPVAITFPILDGGLGRAEERFAQAQREAARMRYAATLRRAIQEVEEALIRLQSAADRQAHAQAAVDGFTQSFQAMQARFKAGGASLLELEDTRRSLTQAQSAQISLQQAQVVAWISLYRAMGGGWANPASPTPSPAATQAP